MRATHRIGPARVPAAGVIAVAVAIAAVACQDLDVTNPNEPDRERALQQGTDVEATVAGNWQTLWARLHNSASTYNALPNIADEMTATYANEASLELSSEPRIAYNNSPISNAAGLSRFQWYDWYSVLSTSNDALASLNSGVRVIRSDVDVSARVRAFAMYMQGIALGYLGLLFDKGPIVFEYDTLPSERSALLAMMRARIAPYPVVLDSAVGRLEATAAFSQANAFVLPDTGQVFYVNGVVLSNQELARLANSYIARFLVYGARNPQERAGLDWNYILARANAGITADHAPNMSSDRLTSSFYSRYQNAGTFVGRADYKLIGPADTSGAYQAWLAKPLNERTPFRIKTPDRRITGVTDSSDGTYFRFRATHTGFAPERGIYHFSHYQWFRTRGNSTSGPAPLIRVEEMRLIKAEALARLGRTAEAVDSLNVTRVRAGLPPWTVADTVAPGGNGCVPQRADGTCADLLESIAYERMIEASGTEAVRAYVDRRGWGTLTKDTFIHLPIPGRELETLELPMYTFGGGGEGSAP